MLCITFGIELLLPLLTNYPTGANTSTHFQSVRKYSSGLSVFKSLDNQIIQITCARMLCFFVTPLWAAADRFVAGVGVSSNRDGLMEFAFGRASDTWDVPVRRAATRNITTQHLFHVETSILEKKKTEIPKTKKEAESLEKPELCAAKTPFLSEKCAPWQCPCVTLARLQNTE